MTRDRFDKISQYFHTNDHSSIPLNARGKPIDKLYLVRRALDIIQNQIQNNYIPYQNVSVDEAMIAFRGCLSFRQYLPAKPTKYGIKVWEVCDSRNGYCFDFDVYLGRPTGPGGNETRKVELGKKTVLKLTENSAIRTITFILTIILLEYTSRGTIAKRHIWLWYNEN